MCGRYKNALLFIFTISLDVARFSVMNIAVLKYGRHEVQES